MKNIIFILSMLVVITGGCSSQGELAVQTEDKFQTINGEQIITEQEIRTLRKADSLPVSTVTKIRINDVLTDFLRTEFQYDNIGNNTIKKSFVREDEEWVLVQEFYFDYRADKQLKSFRTKRIQRNEERGILYCYDDTDRLIEQTEYECYENICDSIFKIRYIYKSQSPIRDSLVYIRQNSEWSLWKHNENRQK